MEEKKWALRRSPTVPQEVHVEPATGMFFGLVDGLLCKWLPIGFKCDGPRTWDLVPLETPPKKALRCWARRNPMEDTPWVSDFDPSSPTNQGWREMIERAPGDKLADALREFEPGEGGNLWKALREYDEATK